MIGEESLAVLKGLDYIYLALGDGILRCRRSKVFLACGPPHEGEFQLPQALASMSTLKDDGMGVQGQQFLGG